MRAINLVKKCLGFPKHKTLNVVNLFNHINIKYGRYFYKKKYTTQDIIDKLKFLGIGEGSNLFVHSSWDVLYNYEGKENDLIQGILDLIGPSGTLVMSAIPLVRKNKIFDVRKTITSTGLLSEAFRRYPGVKRSVNKRHSTCAIGPLSDYLLSEHKDCAFSTDEKSPYYKMCVKGDFKIVSLGLTSYFIGTIVHSVTTTLINEIPYFQKHYNLEQKDTVEYIDYDGRVKSYQNYSKNEKVRISTDYFHTRSLVKKYFPKDSYGSTKLSNLTISFYDASTAYNTLSNLARNGKYIYVSPKA